MKRLAAAYDWRGEYAKGGLTVTKLGERYKVVRHKSLVLAESEAARREREERLLNAAINGMTVFADVPEWDVPSEEAKRVAVSRARTAVKELAMCNDWDYFATLTLDANKVNRYDLPTALRAVKKWIANSNRQRDGEGLKWLIIPEQHKDGAWHFHGLLANFGAGELIRNGHGYVDWEGYRDRFGYISLDKIKSAERVVSYITKYITKDWDAAASGGHRYFHSRNLRRPEKMGKYVSREDDERLEWQFTNDYVATMLVDANRLGEILYGRPKATKQCDRTGECG